MRVTGLDAERQAAGQRRGRGRVARDAAECGHAAGMGVSQIFGWRLSELGFARA